MLISGVVFQLLSYYIPISDYCKICKIGDNYTKNNLINKKIHNPMRKKSLTFYSIPYTIGCMVHKHIHKHKEGDINNKSVKLVNMANGSLAKASMMILEGRYCPEVIQQIDSVIGLLHSTRKELLKGHLESCLIEQLKSDKDGAVKELLKIYNM